MTLGIAGYAVRYNEVVEKGDESIVLLPGVFSSSLKSGATVRLLRDHMDEEYIGSTKGVLTLYDDASTGLAFFVSHFPDTTIGRHLRYMATEARYDSVSIGYQCKEADRTKKTIDGIEIVSVSNAVPIEVSIMSGYGNCACKNSFAVYGDFDSLEEECRSGRMLREGAAVQFMRALRRYQICEGAQFH